MDDCLIQKLKRLPLANNSTLNELINHPKNTVLDFCIIIYNRNIFISNVYICVYVCVCVCVCAYILVVMIVYTLLKTLLALNFNYKLYSIWNSAFLIDSVE